MFGKMQYIATIYGKRYGLLPQFQTEYKACSFETRGKLYAAGTVVETYDDYIRCLDGKEYNKPEYNVNNIADLNTEIINSSKRVQYYFDKYCFPQPSGYDRKEMYKIEIKTKFFVYSGERTTSDGGNTHSLLFYPLYVMNDDGYFDLSDKQIIFPNIKEDLYWFYDEKADDVVNEAINSWNEYCHDKKVKHQKEREKKHMLKFDIVDDFTIKPNKSRSINTIKNNVKSIEAEIQGDGTETEKELQRKRDKMFAEEFYTKAKLKTRDAAYSTRDYHIPSAGSSFWGSYWECDKEEREERNKKIYINNQVSKKAKKIEKDMLKARMDYLKNYLCLPCICGMSFKEPYNLVTDIECNRNIKYIHKAVEGNKRNVTSDVYVLAGVGIVIALLKFAIEQKMGLYELAYNASFLGMCLFILLFWGVPVFFYALFINGVIEKQSGRNLNLDTTNLWKSDKKISDFDKQRDLEDIGSADVKSNNSNKIKESQNKRRI